MPRQSTYAPRPDSIPALVIAHLQKAGGTISNIEIENRFNCGRHNVGALLSKAVAADLLTRIRSTTDARGFAYGLGSVQLGEGNPSATDNHVKGSPFTNPPTGYEKLPKGRIIISDWSDGEVYVHGLQVMSDGSVLFSHTQMREIVKHMTDPLGLRG